MIYFNRPGPCVKLTKITHITNTSKTWILPLESETQFSANQLLQKPIKVFFDALKDFVTSSGGIVGAVVGAASTLTDVFGLKMFNKYYHSQSWAGAEPTPFSLTIKFFRGMAGTWSAQTEVHQPIIELVTECIPWDGKPKERPSALMWTPLPSSVDAFILFSQKIIATSSASVGQAATLLLGPLGGIPGVRELAVDAVVDSIDTKTEGVQTKTWTVSFGWSSGTSDSFQYYFTLPTTIVESVSWSFSPAVEISSVNEKDVVSPITGSITLNFKTQQILTSTDL